MTVMEDKIVNTILSDDELLNYVEKLVNRRLPAGPHLKSDYNWYKQVIDLSINQAFEDLQVVDTLNYQISQLGKYLKKKSQRENQFINDESCEETDISNGDIRSVDHPSFSSSEPIQRTRKLRKDTKRKSNYVSNVSKSDQNLSSKQGNDVDIVSSGQRSHAISNGSNHLTSQKKSTRSKSSNFEENEPEDDVQAGQLPSSTSYKSDLNNLPEKISNYSKFVAASPNLEKSVESSVDGNEFPLQFDIGSSRGLSEFQKNSPSRYSHLQTRNEADSADFCSQEEEDTDIRNLRLKVKPPLIPSLTIGSVTMSTKGPTKSILSTREDQDNDEPYLQAAPRTEGNRLEGFGQFGSSFEGITVDRETKFEGDSEEKGKLGDSELSVDEVEEEKTHVHESNGREVDDKDKGKEKETEDPYYNSDFDNIGYDDDDDEHTDKPAQATAASKPSLSGKNGHSSANNGAFTSWCMPSDNVARVRFVPDVVSDVFLIREKHSLIEIPNLFYTHDESIQFTSDYNRESMKAEAVGLTWYEWWEDRTEDDVLRDEREQQEVEYEDDSDGINGDLSDGSDNFNF